MSQEGVVKMRFKRFILALSAVTMSLTLCACGSDTTNEASSTEEATLNVEADMSSFSGSEDTDTYVFDEYCVDDMIADLEGGESEFVLIASLTDESNAALINAVNDTATESGQRVYLIDYDSMSDDDKQKFVDFYGSLLNTDENGNAIVEAPTLFAVQDGNISFTLIGTDTEYVSTAFNAVSEVTQNAEG